MNLHCSSLGCPEQDPIPYCKECSHAYWIVNDDISFNPRHGFNSEKEIDWNLFSGWEEKFELVDIKDCYFEIFK